MALLWYIFNLTSLLKITHNYNNNIIYTHKLIISHPSSPTEWAKSWEHETKSWTISCKNHNVQRERESLFHKYSQSPSRCSTKHSYLNITLKKMDPTVKTLTLLLPPESRPIAPSNNLETAAPDSLVPGLKVWMRCLVVVSSNELWSIGSSIFEYNLFISTYFVSI